MNMFAKKTIEICQKENIAIYELAIKEEILQTNTTEEEIFNRMKEYLTIMENATEKGRQTKLKSASGLTGGDAYTYSKNKENKSLCGSIISEAIAMALSCSEVNAAMGKIIAAPTAGSCGILPASILSVAKEYNLSIDTQIKGMLTAAYVGRIIASHLALAGAVGGCQAECGSSTAMASAGIVAMLDGTVEQCFCSSAISLKTILGLVCDPVAGLVEIPCIKRNAMGAANAIVAADMALNGVISYVTFDDTIKAMCEVGDKMPSCFKETAEGGLATTETGILLKNKVFNT